jgi:hypothetical protein
MESNPYAPPQAAVADPPSTVHGLKQRRVVVMIVFMLISFGLYYPIWWFRRRAGLNRLNSPKKLAAWPLILLAALFVVQVGLGLVAGPTPLEQVIGDGGALLVAVFQLAIGILMIVQAFRVKDMIEDHATPEADSGPFIARVELSGLMTFFFSVFYLQWAINRYVVGTQN